MKTTTFLILWIFLTFSIHAGNRIPNPGFEEEKDRFWYRTNFGGGEGSVMRVTEKAFSGKGSMRLSKTKAPGGVLLIGLVPLPENWSSGTLSFQMCSADGNAGNAVCELSFFHKIDGKMKPYNNSLKRPYSIRRTLKPGTSWEKVLMKISLPEGIERKNLYLRICLNMSIYQKPATLFVDDFSLTDETEESEKSPLHITFSEPSELSAREKQDYEPMQQPVRIELRDGLMLRDGSPYYWIGNGCELTLPALWLARLSDTAMIDRSYGLFPDLKQTADGCRFSAERGLKALPADQSWNRECLRLGMPYRHLIGGVPYYSWLSLWKLTAKDPALQQIFAPQGHYLFADIGNETGWEATRLVIRNRLKYNNFAPPFALELSREPGYAPTGERMISGFRQYARRKYGTLEKANRAWKTTFSSWEQIYPLHLRPDLKSESIHKLRELAREREPELYYDWLTFCKDDFQESVRRWADFVRKTAPGTPVSIDVRGHTHFLDCYCAMNPEEVTRFADIFYIHQAYQAFRHSAPIDLETLCTQTAYPLFNYNYFRNNVDKPFLDTESVLMRVGVPGSAWKAMERNDLAQLHSSWKFRMDEHFEGEKEQWYAPGFDDSSWDTLTVPGCWDRTEKYRRRIGRAWYRKTFRAPKAVRLDFKEFRDNTSPGTLRQLKFVLRSTGEPQGKKSMIEIRKFNISDAVAASTETPEVKQQADALPSGIDNLKFRLLAVPGVGDGKVTDNGRSGCVISLTNTAKNNYVIALSQLNGRAAAQQKLAFRVRGKSTNGSAHLTTCLESLKLGAAGYSGTSANFYPELLAEQANCFRTNPFRARQLQEFFLLVQRHVEYKYPRSAKLFLRECGVPMTAFCRVACEELNEDEQIQLHALYSGIQAISGNNHLQPQGDVAI